MTRKGCAGLGCLGGLGIIVAGGWITGMGSLLGMLLGIDGAPDRVVAPERVFAAKGSIIGFVPGGKTCFVSNEAGRGEFRSFPAGQLLRTLEGPNNIAYAVSFSADGKRAATVAGDEVISIWNVADGKRVDQFQLGDKSSPRLRNVALSPDGKHVAVSAPIEKTPWVMRVSDGLLIGNREGREYDEAYEVNGWTRDGLLIAKSVFRVQGDKLVLVRSVKKELPNPIVQPGSLWISPDAEWLASDGGGGLYLVHLRDGVTVSCKSPNSGAGPAAWTPDNQRIAIRFQTGDTVTGPHIRSFIELRRAKDGALLHMMQVGTSKTGTDTAGTDLLVSSDGQWLIVNFRDNTIGLWDISRWTTPIPDPPSPHDEGQR